MDKDHKSPLLLGYIITVGMYRMSDVADAEF